MQKYIGENQMSNKKSPQTSGSYKNLKPKKDYINL